MGVYQKAGSDIVDCGGTSMVLGLAAGPDKIMVDQLLTKSKYFLKYFLQKFASTFLFKNQMVQEGTSANLILSVDLK